MKKLYKSNKDKIFSGVIGGIGEYMDTDPTILRLGYILITVFTGIVPAIIAYFIASMIVPTKYTHVEHVIHHHKEKSE